MMRHDKSVSIAKGIGIILMVVSHSGDPDVLNRFIYAFLMPTFLFISGYLFDIKYLDNKKLFLKKQYNRQMKLPEHLLCSYSHLTLHFLVIYMFLPFDY